MRSWCQGWLTVSYDEDLVRRVGSFFLGFSAIAQHALDSFTEQIQLQSGTWILRLLPCLSRGLQANTDYYKVREGAFMPIRWSAPEIISGSRYTSASDVWSFFVLMWEVWAGGERPFGNKSNVLICMMLEEVRDGDAPAASLLRQPDHADGSTYDSLQALCWAADPAGRATFEDLCSWAVDMRRGLSTVPGTADADADAKADVAGASRTCQPHNGSAPYQAVVAGASRTYHQAGQDARRDPAGTATAAGYPRKAPDGGGSTTGQQTPTEETATAAGYPRHASVGGTAASPQSTPNQAAMAGYPRRASVLVGYPRKAAADVPEVRCPGKCHAHASMAQSHAG